MIDNARATAGLYIHIPFCKTKCHYCDFYSVTDQEQQIGRLVAAINVEMKRSSRVETDLAIDTVFIGGGTPSLLEPIHLESMIKAADDAYDLSGVTEFTLEANPGEVSYEKLVSFRSLGVNRLSMGFQSFQPELLTFLGRLHSPHQSVEAFDAARRAGFENINADLIYNIPDQSMSQWEADLQQLIALEPEHVSAYSLTVETGTGLHTLVDSGEVTMPSLEDDRAMLVRTREMLTDAGYDAYEVSNHSKPGRQCAHNLHYWRIDPYLAFGPAAHRFDGSHRSWNVRHLTDYMDRVEAGDSTLSGIETITAIDRYNEKMIFGLRLAEGIDVVETLGFKTVEAFTAHYEALIERWGKSVEQLGNVVRLTEAGILLADAIATDFIGSTPEHISAGA